MAKTAAPAERVVKVTECYERAGEWHVAWEVREGDAVVESHVLGLDAASVAANPAQYQQDHPEAYAAIQAAQAQ